MPTRLLRAVLTSVGNIGVLDGSSLQDDNWSGEPFDVVATDILPHKIDLIPLHLC